jgi:cell fate (sporulation/competence/biofilm development) regulator YlbF (YheA/YmcA/DUF963 family)
MDIITKAKELGTMISTSEEMTNFRRWEESLQRDNKAKVILQEYQHLQTEMLRAAQEETDKSVVDEIKERLILKHDEVSDSEIITNYLESKNRLDKLIKKVNDVLIYLITGEESCSSASNGCSSCSGCK